MTAKLHGHEAGMGKATITTLPETSNSLQYVQTVKFSFKNLMKRMLVPFTPVNLSISSKNGKLGWDMLQIMIGV